MNPALSRLRWCGIALLALLSGCKSEPPRNVAAIVNGRPITYEELDKQCEIQFGSQTVGLSPEEEALRKLEVLRSMIDNEILLQRAEKLGLLAVEEEVEAKLAELRAPYTEEEFRKQLEARRMTEADLREQLRRDLSIQKLFNREITSHIRVTDQEIRQYYEANKALFHFPEPQLHIAQILVTPYPDPEVRNLRHDEARTREEALAKIKAIQARLQQGEDFALVAQAYSEDPNTAPNGGDLGFIPESSLQQAHVEIRKAILALQPGQISGIIETPEGFRILKLISREPAGQRDLNDPRVQQTIRETLRNRKDQLLRAAYYEMVRNEARVTNYYAQRVMEAKGIPSFDKQAR